MVKCVLCSQEWETDPALKVPCTTCGAQIGQPCVRPSGHPVPFGDIHTARDLLALQCVEDYAYCPTSLTNTAQIALPLFSGGET